MKNIGRLISTYKYLLSILMKNAPIMVVSVFVSAVISGVLGPFRVYVNTNLFDISLSIASKEAAFSELTPYIIYFIMLTLLPNLLALYKDGYAEPRSMLILRSAFRGEMLQKLKKMKYEHLESESSMEIIDKAYSRAENSARHLFPMYIFTAVSSAVGAVSYLYIIISVKWWLIFPILIPFIIEMVLTNRSSYNIYTELESYWQKEKEYGLLQSMLKNRDYIRENRLNQASGYLVETYRKRFNARNRNYEKFFFKNIKHIFLSSNISRFAILGNIVILLLLYLNGQMSTGLFISVSLMVFNSIYSELGGSVLVFKWGHYHANFFDYYMKYFKLSEDEQTSTCARPDCYDIEFKDVWFKYPGTERYILKGLSLHIKNGEKTSIVGENGEGKSTMVKLLLGLFTPDRGEILIGGRLLKDISLETKTSLFGTVFQDFNRFNITLKENIVIGGLDGADDDKRFNEIINKSGLEEVSKNLQEGTDTLLGKEFEGGIDLSGGQWQRIALARALYGNKPILIFDEPTSQLDPMAESALYSEFADIAGGKTSLFITHRLGSTAITDRIIVISEGRAVQTGTHEELLRVGGLYADMFEAQRSWYDHNRLSENSTGKEEKLYV